MKLRNCTKMLNNPPVDVKFVLDKLEQNGYEAYLVGGSVRDALLGVIPKDYDIVTNATVEKIQKIFKSYKQCKGNFAKHGTVSIIIDKNPIDVSTYRNGAMTIEEDLTYRDFTINAMAYNKKNGLIDHYNGQKDLMYGVVRGVGDCSQRFLENGTRVLRALRFSSQLGFIIDEHTKQVIHEVHGEVLKNLAVEQVERELKGILTGNGPYVLYVLQEFEDVISYVLPELKPCLNFIQNNKYHKHQNLYVHITHVVASTKPDYATRFAALMHDVGKPNCYSEAIDDDGSLHGHFYGHAYESRKLTEPALTRLKVCNKTKEEVLFLIENHDYPFDNSKKNVGKILSKTPDRDFDLFLKLVDLRLADRKDHQLNCKDVPNMDDIIETAKQILDKETNCQISNLKVNGYDVMRFGYVGVEVGQVLEYLHSLVLNDKIKNDRKELIFYLYENTIATVAKRS